MNNERVFLCGSRSLLLDRCHVMGILNVTPDSFSDGGQYNSPEVALKRAKQLVQHGASIIDIGGESTRPGAKPISTEEELRRVIPIIKKLHSQIDAVLSIDTSNPIVMLEAANAGVHLINDVRALQQKGALLAAKKTGLSVCLMHMQGKPSTMQENPNYKKNIIDDVCRFLQKRIHACQQQGIDKNKLLIDPGFGFGKSVTHNYQLLAQLDKLQYLNIPILVGLSRKSMIGAVLNNATVDNRLYGSLAGACIARLKGAQIIRVHDVKATSEALRIVDACMLKKELP